MRLTRENEGASGNVHFSATSMLRNSRGVRDTLREHVYDAPALVPASPWLATAPAARPQVTATFDSAFNATAVQLSAAVQPSTWIVRARSGSQWQTLLLPGTATSTFIDWTNGVAPELIAVSAVDRVGVESEPALLLETAVAVTATRSASRPPK